MSCGLLDLLLRVFVNGIHFSIASMPLGLSG